MKNNLGKDEIGRINSIYQERNYDRDLAYSDLNPTYLQRTQSIERCILNVLAQEGFSEKMPRVRVLDFGCGNGRWLSRWLSWGALPGNLAGVDVREDAVQQARQILPQAQIKAMTSLEIPYDRASFDVVFVNVVFSSILDGGHREALARDIERVLKPGGVLLFSDFVFNNPKNPNVQRVPYADLCALFSGLFPIRKRKIILAPPLARKIVPRAWWAGAFLEWLCPFLRTHLFVAFRKDNSVS